MSAEAAEAPSVCRPGFLPRQAVTLGINPDYSLKGLMLKLENRSQNTPCGRNYRWDRNKEEAGMDAGREGMEGG